MPAVALSSIYINTRKYNAYRNCWEWGDIQAQHHQCLPIQFPAVGKHLDQGDSPDT